MSQVIGGQVVDLASYRLRRLDPFEISDPYIEEAMLALREMRESGDIDPEFGALMSSAPYGSDNNEALVVVSGAWEELEHW